MVTEPKIEKRSEQHYMAIRKKVNMKDISSVLPPLIGEVTEWLRTNNIPADGSAFFHYQAMNDRDELDVAVGLLVQSQETGNGHIVAGFFPAGNYAIITYLGDYRNMREGHIALESWIKQNGLKEKQQKSDQGIEWGGRAEFYLTDPQTEPNPEKWKTDIVFLLED
jgi:effector-binding domain-containing protein